MLCRRGLLLSEGDESVSTLTDSNVPEPQASSRPCAWASPHLLLQAPRSGPRGRDPGPGVWAAQRGLLPWDLQPPRVGPPGMRERKVRTGDSPYMSIVDPTDIY